MTPVVTTVERTIRAGRTLRRGALASYHALATGAGEPHLVRHDLAPPPGGDGAGGPRRPLLCLAHVTDLQVADVQSPARFEFLNREFADPRFAALVPTQRPQEALTVHAVDAMVRTLNALPGGPVTGAPVQVVVTTGDAIDNAQWNELQMFLALLRGGRVRPGSGGPRYEGVQALDWPDDVFWRPDGDGADGPDLFRRLLGFPHHPGLLARALADFQAGGLRLPWLGCFGNHEGLTQGAGALTSELRRYLVGGSKPLRLPDDLDRDKAVAVFMETPEAFLAGPQRAVTPDPERRAITRRDFLAAHLRAGGRPPGHGFSSPNLRDDTAYYTYDLPGVRLVGLDTCRLAGGTDGCLDRDQARWLEQRLAETGDRLVVVFSHHGSDTLTGGGALTALLHRFPNVVLWLNGHTHRNRVRAWPHPTDRGGGLWEVTTCAVVDWPSQARLVELVDNGDGTLSVLCSMLDHDSAVRPDDAADREQLASLHRELAANLQWLGPGSPPAGSPGDRNVDLRLPAPFPLRRLPGR